MACIIIKDFVSALYKATDNKTASVEEIINELSDNLVTDSLETIESISEASQEDNQNFVKSYSATLKALLKTRLVKEGETFDDTFSIAGREYSYKGNEFLNTYFKPTDNNAETARKDVFRDPEIARQMDELFVAIYNNHVERNKALVTTSTDVATDIGQPGDNISDADVSENIAEQEDENSDDRYIFDTVKFLEKKANKNKNGGILEPTLFMQTFFNRAESFYAEEYIPYVKMTIRNVVLNNIREVDDTIADRDIDENPVASLQYMLDEIGDRYGVVVNTLQLQDQIKLLTKELGAKVNDLFNRNSNLASFTSLERKLYYDYILVKEMPTTINNDANFFVVEVEKKRMIKDQKVVSFRSIKYKYNLEVVNKRINYDDAKKGDKNAQFIRSLIESTPRLVSAEKLSESKLMRLTNVSKEEFDANKEGDESIVEYIKRVKLKGNTYIYDTEHKVIHYSQFNALTIEDEFLNNNFNDESVVAFLKEKAEKGDIVAASLYNSFYSDRDIQFFDPETGKLKVMRSLSSIVNTLSFSSRNRRYADLGLGHIMNAFTSGFRSRDGRAKLNNDGTVSSSMTADVRELTISKLTQSIATYSDNNKVEIYDKLKSNILGKVKFSRNKEDNIIFLEVRVDDIVHRIPLKQNVSVSPENSSMIVLAERSDGDWSKSVNGSYVISDSVGVDILETLGFPSDLIKNIVNVINSGVRTEKGDMKPDFTAFVVNYATLIALNDDTVNIPDSILNSLGFGTKDGKIHIPTKKTIRHRTDLKFDVYDYLWKFENSILKEQELKNGVDGESQHKSGGNKAVSKITTAQNSNINKNINQVRKSHEDIANYVGTRVVDGDIIEEKNSLVSGETVILSHAFKTGVFDPGQNREVGIKQMTEGNKLQQNVENLFMNSVIDTFDSTREANVQISASESNLLEVYRITKGPKHEFIPFKEKSLDLDEVKLSNQLIKANRSNVNAIQDTVVRNYKKAFVFEFKEGAKDGYNNLTPESQEVVDKFKSIFPAKSHVEIMNTIERIGTRLNEEINPSDVNKLFYLNEILKSEIANGDLDVKVLNLLNHILQGSFYNSKGHINNQLLYDIDLWNDNMNNSPMDYDSKHITSPMQYIRQLTKLNISYVNRSEIKTRLTRKTVDKFKEFVKKKHGRDVDNLSDDKIHTILHKAYHFNEMIFSTEVNPLMYGDDYVFMKYDDTIEQSSKDFDEDSKANMFIMTKLANDAQAMSTKYKRVKPNQTGGDVFCIGPRGLADHENTFAFDSFKNKKNTLGDLKEIMPEVHDGAQYIFPLALYMREIALSSKYSTNIKGAIMKDINMEFVPGMRGKFTDKKATQAIFNYETQEDLSFNFIKRFREAIPFMADGSKANVLVPVMITKTVDGKLVTSIDTNAEFVNKQFKNIQELIEYMGDTFNPNILRDTTNILMLKENIHIKDKYPATISFVDTRKTGTPVLNDPSNLFDESKQLFPMKVPTHSMRVVLEMFKDMSVQHKAAIATQAMSASFAGIGSKKHGIAIFKALGGLYETGALDLDVELRGVIDDVLANISLYESNPKKAKVMLNKVLELEQRLEGEDTFEGLKSLFGNEIYDEAISFVLKAYAINEMKADLTKKSDSTSLKAVLESNGDINGSLNSIFQSIIRTKLSNKSLNIEPDSFYQGALQEEGFKNVYEKNGKVQVKNDFMRSNTSNETKNVQSYEITQAHNNAKVIYVDSVESYKQNFNNDDIIVYNGSDAKELHNFINSANGKKVLVLNEDLSIYTDFAVVDSAKKYSIINKIKDSNYMDKIVILDTSNNIEVRVSSLIDKLLIEGTIIQNC